MDFYAQKIWGVSSPSSVSMLGNVPQILPQMGELTHPPLETLDLRSTMEVYPPSIPHPLSWSRPLGVKQVARPNVGYCRQLVDFEKTSTGWGDLMVGSWLGE